MKKAVDPIREEFRSEMEKKWKRKDMVDYEVKSADVIVRLSDGSLLSIDKPSIETHFCFDDSYDYDGALKMADHAAKSESYFKRENLKPIDDMIAGVNDPFVKIYVSRRDDCNEACLAFVRWTNTDWYDARPEWSPMSDADKETLIAAYKLVRDHFEKRLDTYLKRFGMSKIRTWTYWGEA